MVSQVEPSQTLTTTTSSRRGPSSVISRSSRRHRHGRSHAGGSAYLPQNDFPIFSQTGDVEILVKAGGTTNRYLLHRIYLAQCSGFFEASTSQEWSRATTSEEGSRSHTGGELARIGEESAGKDVVRAREGKKRWRYELDFGATDDDIPMLVQKDSSSASLFGGGVGGGSIGGDARPPPVRNKPPTSNASFFRSVANLSLVPQQQEPPAQLTPEELDLLNDYDNLFRIFYNYAPALDGIDIATAYLQCKSLLALADQYDALAVVGPRVDHHLLQFQSRLWKQIAKYPSSYLKIGYLAQSRSIFQEALIHVVGAWPVGERHIRSQLPDAVLDIIEDKVEDLEDMVSKIESRLFRLTLTTSRGERVTPYNSFLDWQAISLFRQWVSENTCPPPPPPPRSPSSRDNNHNGSNTRQQQLPPPPTQQHAPPSQTITHLPLSSPPPPSAALYNGHAYRLLGGAPTAYLTHDDCKRFLKLTPELYSRETLRKFERRLDELKAAARDCVRPLMRSALEGEASGVGYLVCTRVEERDFPWL